jgi:hypothetical protein
VVPVLFASQWLLTCYSCPFPVGFACRLVDVMLQARFFFFWLGPAPLPLPAHACRAASPAPGSPARAVLFLDLSKGQHRPLAAALPRGLGQAAAARSAGGLLPLVLAMG